MKSGVYFLGAILTVCLSVNNAFAWSDTYPHSPTTTGCTTHVSLPTQYIYNASYTFILCVAASGATQWKATFLDGNNNPIASCPGFGWTTNVSPGAVPAITFPWERLRQVSLGKGLGRVTK